MEKRRQPETIAGRVNADGTIAAGDGFTVQKTGTGTYNIFFASSFRAVSAHANRNDGNAGGAGSVFVGGTSISVTMFATNTAANTDLPFAFTAVGVQQ